MIAGSSDRWQLGFWIALGVWMPALHASAQDHFVLLDQTYTATSANTMDSHYRVDPRMGTPSNWRSPIDYASGKVHARLDVISKPSAKKTLYNICFEATPSYACMPYAMYSATGVVDIEFPFSSFYQYNDVDWSKGIRDIALILKDENQTKMQGSPDFYPTTVHATLTVIKPGASYVPPSDAIDAGMPADAGEPDDAAAPVADASTVHDAGAAKPADAGTPAAPVDAGHSGSGGTGSAGTSGAMAGTSAPMASTVPSAPMAMMPGSPAGTAGSGSAAGAPAAEPRGTQRAGGGCSLTRGGTSAIAWPLAWIALVWSRRRRARRRSANA
jgi:hypothetical protein